MPEIPPSSDVYDFIIFRGQDIKDLTVLEACNAVNDPAIVSINQRPPGGKGLAGSGKAPAKGSAAGVGGGVGSGGSGYPLWNKRPSGDGRSAGNYGWGQGSGSGGRQNQQNNYNAWGQCDSRQNQYKGGGGYGWGHQGRNLGGRYDGGGEGTYGGYGKGGGVKAGQKGNEVKAGKVPKGRGKGGKGSSKGGSEVGRGNPNVGGQGGGARRGGSSNVPGAPVGELPPEENAEAKKEFAEDFNYEAANEKFDKVQIIESVEGDAGVVEERLKPLSGYDKGKSFFDNISCEATERTVEAERQKVDREKARQFDRETFGNTRRPPRPTVARPGKGRSK